MNHSVSPLVIILAAGQSKRMLSSMSKVLHPVGGLPLLGHVLHTAQALNPCAIALVRGDDGDDVEAFAKTIAPDIQSFIQHERLGTAHAVLAARQAILAYGDHPIVILLGDAPFVSELIITHNLEALQQGAGMSVTAFHTDNPFGYGRMVMEGEQLLRIVEQKDATEKEQAISFCNSGLMTFAGEHCLSILEAIEPNNAQKEYYITDAVTICNQRGLTVKAIDAPQNDFIGINDRRQLAFAESFFQQRKRQDILQQGVTLTAPETVFFAYDTKLEQDVVVEPHVVFGKGVYVEKGSFIRSFSHLEGCYIGQNAQIGPYARLRPDSHIAQNAKIGNFVETKKVAIGEGAKVNHLSYIGDAEIGAKANIGAGTITCNYDGFSKHKTKIGEGAFIGSNSALVAPVEIGDGAYVGSGSVITDDVEADDLALGRARQSIIKGWAKKFRETFKR